MRLKLRGGNDRVNLVATGLKLDSLTMCVLWVGTWVRQVS